jgi:hypothetical protein
MESRFEYCEDFEEAGADWEISGFGREAQADGA